MVLGFNHNVMYKGEIFHVQTEDSGVSSPHIITLLYRGGVILCSKKTSYADILKIENLESVVEELMKDQHKEMMRRLKSGEFDQRAFQAPPSSRAGAVADKPPVSPPGADSGLLSAPLAPPSPSSAKTDISLLFATPVPQQDAAARQEAADRDNAAKEVVKLDDAILAFFGANDK
ncbi:hypothetical protein F6V30_07090 [Oryzomonas sagensis]|uniref:Uncharacterized protein n=1 Tax=Oryzomonas sagensis TaxID=2603857 RepID=A0ABQ6TTR7_9BACT|nr:hypothetical protein [Oryzomonas sagensis]KAB0672320.1 hypothetical protein F6V30_07090 [Oryzomonas sagensis]